MIALGVLGAMLLFAIAGTGPTVCVVRRLRRQSSPAGKVVASLVAALAISGALGTVIGLIKAFGAIGGETVDPSQKARILAEGISEAMNGAALSVVIWVPSVIAALVLARRRKGPASDVAR